MVKENKDTAYLEQCVSYRPKLIFFFCFFKFHPSNLFIKKKKKFHPSNSVFKQKTYLMVLSFYNRKWKIWVRSMLKIV